VCDTRRDSSRTTRRRLTHAWSTTSTSQAMAFAEKTLQLARENEARAGRPWLLFTWWKVTRRIDRRSACDETLPIVQNPPCEAPLSRAGERGTAGESRTAPLPPAP
jgi:hypothetical protein